MSLTLTFRWSWRSDDLDILSMLGRKARQNIRLYLFYSGLMTPLFEFLHFLRNVETGGSLMRECLWLHQDKICGQWSQSPGVYPFLRDQRPVNVRSEQPAGNNDNFWHVSSSRYSQSFTFIRLKPPCPKSEPKMWVADLWNLRIGHHGISEILVSTSS